MTERKKLFSGIQPTGELHFGNLVGALDNWVTMQKEYEAYFCVVDLHAMTVPYDAAELNRTRLNTAKLVIAAGVDPARSLFYFQSQVPQHAELTWILGTIAGIGQLERMTQYKEKADRAGQNLGLLSYPVLMAADILIHRVHAVPVGHDQTQHLELTRDLVVKFNSRYGETFPLPDRVTPKLGARVMSLQNPHAKMSKSDPDPDSRVNLLDEPEIIRKKLKGSVTDSERVVRYDWDVSTTRRWMNVLAPLARPLFEINHHAIMRWGGEGLARLLGTRARYGRGTPDRGPLAAATGVEETGSAAASG